MVDRTSSDSDVPLKKKRSTKSSKSSFRNEEGDADSEDSMPIKKRRECATRAREASKKTLLAEEADDDHASGSGDADSEDLEYDKLDGKTKKGKQRAPSTKQRPPRKATGAPKGNSNTAAGAGASSKPKRKPAKAASGTEGEKKSPNPAAGRKPRGAGGGGARRGRAKEEEEEEEVPNDARKYFKEGQKHITPPNGEGTRAFYESLYEENPNSLIALRYVIEYGVLTGTKLHESLPKYALLKELGAFKGAGGGVQPEFKEGLSEQQLAAAKKALEVKGWTGLKKK
ncbi:high mobility group protein b1 [Cystoisospora suis]|uniref:High mobility group protein b1 n=1 Tax=Cystoisospora suis TaxID=483139 RepID=A0A2C6KDM7_9APIC|nr:high mobility group protein b1 [Cystoisospora suis]